MKVLLFFLLSHAAFAGDRIGNGGDALACINVPERPLMEMLDTYMSRELLSLTPGLADAPTNYQDIVTGLLDRLQVMNPTRAEKYRNWYTTFHDEAEFLPNIILIDIPDTGAQVIPNGCDLRQIAVQRTVDEMFPGDKRYTISQDLWAQMSEFNKAVLVVHELAYRERLEGEWRTDSRYVRYLTAHIIAEEVLETSFQRLAVTANLDSYDSGDLLINVKSKIREKNSKQLFNNIDMRDDKCGGCGKYAPSVSLSVLGNEYLNDVKCQDLSFEFLMPETDPLDIQTAKFRACDKPISATITVAGGIQYHMEFKTVSSVGWSPKESMFRGHAGVFEIPEISMRCRDGLDIKLFYATNKIQCSSGTYDVESIEMN